MTDPARRHALTETAATYGAQAAAASHKKLSISLPTDLVEQVRVAAGQSGVSASGVIASALRRSIAVAEQERLDRALALDAEANLVWATDALAFSEGQWQDTAVPASAKCVYDLPTTTVRRVRELSEELAAAASPDAVVALAIERLYLEIRDRVDAERWSAAAQDPEFVAEMSEIERDLRYAETLPD